jgi:hypothetical protein
MLAETKLSPAARADGPLAEGFQTELLDLARLADIQPEWRRLLDDACDPNPFLGPDFFLPLVGHVAGDRLTGVMVLRSDEARGSSELASFFPYRIASADVAPGGGGVHPSLRERRDAAPAP